MREYTGNTYISGTHLVAVLDPYTSISSIFLSSRVRGSAFCQRLSQVLRTGTCVHRLAIARDPEPNGSGLLKSEKEEVPGSEDTPVRVWGLHSVIQYMDVAEIRKIPKGHVLFHVLWWMNM